MFSIQDGRTSFYQWDLDRKLVIDDKSINEVHFCNRTDSCSLVCEVYEENGKRVVNVPNILLQTDWKINVYAYNENYTKFSDCFDVVKRTKPADYVYTEAEFITLEKAVESAVAERIEPVEQAVNNLHSDFYGLVEVVNDFNADIGDIMNTNSAQQEQIDALLAQSGGGGLVGYELLAQTTLTEDATQIIWTQTKDGKPLSDYKDFFIYWTGKFDNAVNNEAMLFFANNGNMYYTYHFLNKLNAKCGFWWQLDEVFKSPTTGTTLWKCVFPTALMTGITEDFSFSNQGLHGSNKQLMSDLCCNTSGYIISKLTIGSLTNGAKMVAGSKAILLGRAR